MTRFVELHVKGRPGWPIIVNVDKIAGFTANPSKTSRSVGLPTPDGTYISFGGGGDEEGVTVEESFETVKWMVFKEVNNAITVNIETHGDLPTFKLKDEFGVFR